MAITTSGRGSPRTAKSGGRRNDQPTRLRPSLAIDEKSQGPEHAGVGTHLNYLAEMLRGTNRLREAEPLMRRHVGIFRDLGRSTGHEHPHMQDALGNYHALLKDMKRSEEEIAARMRDVMR